MQASLHAYRCPFKYSCQDVIQRRHPGLWMSGAAGSVSEPIHVFYE